MASYYNCFNRNLGNIDQVVTDGKVVRALIRDLGARRREVGNTFRVVSVYTPGKLAERVKSYIDIERAEGRLVGAYPGTTREREAPSR